MITKTQLQTLYVRNNLSMKDVADVLGVGIGSVHRAIHKLGISPRGVSSAGGKWNKGKTYQEDSRILSKENHPRYIDGRTYWSDFKAVRKELLPDGCVECSEATNTLHHIDLNKHNDSLDNLVPLCSSCHSRHHNQIRDSYIALLRGRGIEFEDRVTFKIPEEVK